MSRLPVPARLRPGITALVAGVLASCALLAPIALAADKPTITPNYKDADIRQVIEAVGEVTGKNFVLDPRVKAQVTMLSASPMSPEAFYEAFLSILQVYGFVAVPAGNIVKILPDANARQSPGAESEAGGGQRPDDIVTRIIAVENVSAAQLVPILRPLIPQYGHLAAHPPSNLLIISDRSSNVDRMLKIVARIDQAADQDYEVIRLEHASASEVVKIVGALNQAAGQGEGAGGPRVTVVADERTNSVLMTGDKNDRLRYRALITHLDTPLQEGGDTQVRYLRYTDAKDLATKLQSQYSQGAAAPTKEGAPPAQRGDISIWADDSTNALILTAPPKTMRAMMAVIDKLDIRRLQVLVQAIIVEVSSTKAANLGVTWAVGNKDLNHVVGVTKFDKSLGITGIAGGIIGGGGSGTGATANPLNLIGNGITMGIGRLSDNGLSFAAIIEALESEGSTNIIGTPTLVTLDNEEAKIEVGQEVPFVTGQYTNGGTTTGGGATNTVNPFQTITREQVGLTLKITPQINEGDAVRLKIEQEISNLLTSPSSGNPITSNRKIDTSVIVEDGGTLVLGGLIQDTVREGEQRVPLLGRIPILGALFRSDDTTKEKTNLMVFIRPTILRDDVQASFETNAKYNYLRDLQLGTKPPNPRLMPMTPRPVLPPLEPREPKAPAPAGSATPPVTPGPPTEAPAIDLRPPVQEQAGGPAGG